MIKFKNLMYFIKHFINGKWENNFILNKNLFVLHN